MSSNIQIRSSREGDQFHYTWAARRCLRLLSATANLVAVSIEGASTQEAADGESIENGEDVIDVAEYYGSEVLQEAKLVRYIQLKHSTKRRSMTWTLSGLKKTLSGFSKRFQQIEERLGTHRLEGRLEFAFISNRPINAKLMAALKGIASGDHNQQPSIRRELEAITSLVGKTLSAFCRILSLEGSQGAYLLQRSSLAREANFYLPGNDVDAPLQLRHLVTTKALPESAQQPSIRKTDVLEALGTTEDRLFPAPSRIELAEEAIRRHQESSLVAKIVAADAPTVIHAEGGVGKSVLSQRIQDYLPPGSMTIVYDCFGNGEYRRSSSPRHRHKDALVQMANELAARGICDCLIPSSKADKTDYMRAFVHRLKQSINTLREETAECLLCLVIDAADNAELAAMEFGDGPSFAYDLLRETFPEGVRFVSLCRTERLNLLAPSQNVLRLELLPFEREETGAFLRKTYPDASDDDVEEFHRFTSRNPRVQATVLAQGGTLSEILQSLGPDPTTQDKAIAELLERAVGKIRDLAGSTEQSQIDAICAALAVLRPVVPVSVLAAVSGVQDSAVRSFVADLGRPLLLTGDAVQFRDEPVETWFRDRFRPDQNKLDAFIDALHPHSPTSAYVGTALPLLMLEAGQLLELIDLALSSSSLPEASLVEKREVELQRLQFALKASLRSQRFEDATKLALKAAQVTTGDARLQMLFQSNTDLVGGLFEPTRIQEILSRKTFKGGWTGARHAYEAGLLSSVKGFGAEARSRLRMTHQWLVHWSHLSEKERRQKPIEYEDIAEIAMTLLNLHGPDACAIQLRRWKPRELSFRVGLIIARRLIDHARYDDLDDLALQATNNLCLLLGVNLELRSIHRTAPRKSIDSALRIILNPRIRLQEDRFDHDATIIRSLTALVESAYLLRLRNNDVLASLLERYLPEPPSRGWNSRFGGKRFAYLRAYTLKAGLRSHRIELKDMAHSDLRDELQKENTNYTSGAVREFKEDVGALLPWHKAWAETFLNPIESASDLEVIISAANQESSKATKNTYQNHSPTADEIARVWFDIVVQCRGFQEPLMQEFSDWAARLPRRLSTATLTRLAHLAARTASFHENAYGWVRQAFEVTRDARENAETKAETYVELARALLSMDEAEAREYFDQAVAVVSKLGDEVLDRWQALLDLADRAANPNQPRPEAAFALARAAELIYNDFVVRDKHWDWEGTVIAIAGLCPYSSITILSRWRDRQFGSHLRLLPILVPRLVEEGWITSKTATALVGFQASWRFEQFLEQVLKNSASRAESESILYHYYDYLCLEDHSYSVWQTFQSLAVANGMDSMQAQEFLEFADHQDRRNPSAEIFLKNDAPRVEEDSADEWDPVFSNLELYTTLGLSAAYGNFRDMGPPVDYTRFFEELFKRVPPGKVTQFIQAFSESPEFDSYDVNRFLEQFPKTWKSRMAVQVSLGEMVKKFCRRYWMEISKSRYYQSSFSLRLASEVSGVSEEELIGVVLATIGSTTDSLKAGRLFSLSGLLASKLSQGEALQVLNFGLSLLDESLSEEDGDGQWTTDLKPPSNFSSVIAGYIWGALAAPQAQLRWQASHVVRGLCSLGEQPVLDRLVELAQDGSGGPFVDPHLHFYRLHARQWLLISFARAAAENPTILVPYAGFFMRLALDDDPHVIIRHFAAKAVLALVDNGSLHIDEDDRDRLRAVNAPKLPVVSSIRYQRQYSAEHGDDSPKRFFFGYDIPEYWFKRLGDCFARNRVDIGRMAEDVILEDWKLSETGHRDRDERARRRLYREREGMHSHGSYPKTDDLSFYLSYHALMTVAGKLLSSSPVHQDPEESDDEFTSWMRRHLLTREDGRWLADRRDSKPLEWPKWKDEAQRDHWHWSVCRKDFEYLLRLGCAELNLWGWWLMISGSREESVSIRSAFVTSKRSAALLRALQTADPRSYLIPAAGDDLEIDEGSFQLTGWVDDDSHEHGLDKFDPWAGEIDYPPPKPSQFVCDLLQLESEPESRVWSLEAEGGAGKQVIWSQVWGTHVRDDREEGEHGQRLQVSYPFLLKMLSKVDKDLIVEVQVDRRKHYHYYERRDYEGYREPYFRIFIFTADGHVYSL